MERDVSFGHWLKKLRKARDLTQDALAQQACCAVDTIKKIETGLRRPSRQLAGQLAGCLGLLEDERAAFLAAARPSASTDLSPAPSHDGPEERQQPPSGTVTFLFTDIEGSTRLWEQHPQAMAGALPRHDAIMRQAIAEQGGLVYKVVGDAFQAAFPTALAACAAALAAQRALASEDWGVVGALPVRMALHTCAAVPADGDYRTAALNRLGRLLGAVHGGQIVLSQTTANLARETLPPDVTLRDLGERHLRDLRPEPVFQLVAPDLSSEFPPLRTLDRPHHNLPAQLTPLIGRQEEVAAVCEQLRRDGVRLLTLSGPGGTGKTRLAIQAAAELIETFTDGVFFVDLAPITDPTLFASTIAVTLGVQEMSTQPLIERLKNYLKSKQLLLILDNFEQILEAAPLVEAMLVAAPHLKVLVTSREVLHLYGEHELIVPPLAVPDPARLPPLESLSQYDAVRLFIERAQAVKSDFTVTNANAPAVAEICVRVDGLPLAIELAAVRSKLFAPEQLLERLKNRLQMLTGGARTLPARQQTLRNAIDWSYTLLGANEQRLFTRLGVFVGGCTAEAADAMCNTDPALGMDVLDALVSLIDKSLLKQEQERDGEPRFVMLETIREYALERLTASGEANALRTAHTAYYLALAEHAEPALKGAEQAIWLQRLEAEHDNFRAALQWLIDRGTQEQALRLAGALWRFWRLRGYLSEGRRWLDAALARERTTRLLDSEPALAAARARALTGAGILAHYQGDFAPATALCGESLTLFRRLGDRPGIAAALHGLALVARSGGNYAAARAMYQESLAINRELGDIWGSASSLCYLGVVSMFDAKYAEARPVLEESLALFKQAGDPEGHAVALLSLGIVSWGEGDNRSAWSLTAEALTAFRNLGSRRYDASALSELARIAASSGDVATARELYEESLELIIELGDRFSVAQTLERLADVAVRLRNPAWAARLLGAAHTLFEALGVPRATMDAPNYERCAAAARAQLGAQAFASAWAAGQMMTPQEAVASEESPLPLSQQRHTPPAVLRPDPNGLTAREVEILRLVAQGLTDAQVAERLIISPRTVQGHLRSIYGKLEVTSRTAAARYAADHQLL